MGVNPSSEEAIVGNYRVYAGDDAQSHVAEFNLSLRPDLTNTDKIRGLQIRPPSSRSAQEAADLANFHNAPNRRLATWLSGYTEIGLGDGSTYSFGPGDLVIFEDTTGQGHTTKVSADTITVFILLPD